MSKKNMALLGATFVSLIYGLTFTIAKDVMPFYLGAYGFIFLRAGGATFLFWIIWLVLPKEKIYKQDFPRIIASAFFGISLNMLTFFKGLSYTTPIVASVIMVSTPIIVLLLSAIMLKEKIHPQKIIGILLGVVGTGILILFGKKVGQGSNVGLGNFLVLINAVSYGVYLIIVRKLMAKYNPFSFVNWIYLFGFLMVAPFEWSEIQAVQWAIIPISIYCKIGFVIVFSTFVTYLLNLLSMKVLSPTAVAVFIYLQPFFATIFAIALGKDELNIVKVSAATMIFLGVYLVTALKSKEHL